MKTIETTTINTDYIYVSNVCVFAYVFQDVFQDYVGLLHGTRKFFLKEIKS